MTEAGYSGTPLLKKLGVKDGMNALFAGVPVRIELLEDFKNWKNFKRAKTHRGINGGPYDYIHYFTNMRTDLERAFPLLKNELCQAGLIWISWPKKASGVPCNMTDADIRSLGLKAGLVDIKVCAVDEIWSGLKFVIPVKDRKK